MTLSTEIWGDWDVDIGLQFDRAGNPVPLAYGTIPECDDTRVLVGFALDF